MQFEKVNNSELTPETESIGSPIKMVSQRSTDANDDGMS